MTRDRQGYEDKGSQQVGRNGTELLEAESLRSASKSHSADDPRGGEEKISLFWRVFGGTILSIVALVLITVYNQVAGSLADLRKDVIQLHENRGELIRKDEFNTRMTSVWNGVKELQQSNQTLAALNERSKVLDQQRERRTQLAEEDRKDLNRRLEDQRKALEDDRRETQRKLEEQRKAFEDERKELTRRLHELSERLARVEGHGAGSSSSSQRKD